jgi:hypothetical protein
MIPPVIKLAQVKSLCSNQITGNFAVFSVAAKTALVDIRLMLNFEPRRQAAHMMAADLVASHMHTAYSVPKNIFVLVIFLSLLWRRVLHNNSESFICSRVTL